MPRRAATVTRRADKRLMLILFSCLTSEGRGVRVGGRGGGTVAGLLAVAVWLICASHKKFNFISPFLISYSARRIWRKQSTLDDNNYDAPDPGFQIQGPVRKPEPWENNAKKNAWLALYLYISYTFLFFFSLSLFFFFDILFPFCRMLHARATSKTNSK